LEAVDLPRQFFKLEGRHSQPCWFSRFRLLRKVECSVGSAIVSKEIYKTMGKVYIRLQAKNFAHHSFCGFLTGRRIEHRTRSLVRRTTYCP
jgi:hypothetical protein